jgi:hypothetical protein
MTEEQTQAVSETTAEPVIENTGEPSEVDTASSASTDEDRFAEEILGYAPETQEVKEETEETEETKKESEETKEEPEQNKEATLEEKAKEVLEKNLGTEKKPSGLDKRIATLYLNNQLLRGEETAYTFEQVLEEVKNHPAEEKTETLKRLLGERKELRGQEDDGQMSQEDAEAIIDAEAEKRFESLQREIVEKDWHEDLVKTVESHPELDEKSKQFDPELTLMVEGMVRSGKKASEALAYIQSVQEKIKVRALKEAEKDRQKDLSGSVNATAPSGLTKEAPKDDADKFVAEIMGNL